MAPVAAALVDRAQVEQFPGMPEPAVLRRHSAGGETVVSHGRRVVFRYADADTAMRNLAVVALSDAGVPGVEVAATFGLSQKYLCRLRGQASRYVAAGLVVRRGRPPKLSAWEGALVRRWAGEGATQTEVAARCKVARSVISQLLDRLQPLPVQETLNPHRTLSLPVLRLRCRGHWYRRCGQGRCHLGCRGHSYRRCRPGRCRCRRAWGVPTCAGVATVV